VQYMAPEQLEGKDADARTDIFAFGAVLYEMATGNKAFSGATQASLISAILRDDPQPISELQPMTPPALERLVRRCLAKDPERRWQSSRDVALELEASVGTDASAPEPSGRRRARMAMAGWGVAALLLLLLLAAVLGPWARRRTTAAPPVRFTILPATGSPVGGALALSPDGRSLAFVGTTADGRDLVFIRPLDSLEARVLNGTDEAAFPFWSPDGRALAFFARGKLKRIDAAGGAPQTLCDAPGARGGAWSAGMIVFSSDVGGQMKIVSEAGGGARPLEQLISRNGEQYRWPNFLPDGRHFLYFAFGSDATRTGVFVTSLDSKVTTRLASGDSGAAYASPGYLLYRSGDQLVRQPFDARRLRLTGDAVPLVENIWWDAISTWATAFSVSEGGVLAYQTGGVTLSRLLWYDRSGREMGAIGPPGAYIEPALSPDGRWLAMTRGDQRAMGSSIWTVDLERGNFTRLSFERAATPVWSPDSRRIAYCSFPSGEIWARDIHGAEKEKLLHKAPSFSPLDDWSRDGRYLVHEVVDWKTFHFDIGLLDLQNGTERRLLTEPFNQMGARLSPDGRWLAYESAESGDHEIFIRSFPEAKDRRQISAGGGSQPRWRGDGKELFFISPDRKLMAVDVRTEPAFSAGNPHVLFQTRILPLVEARNHYDVTADGRRFVVNSRRPEDASLPITVVVGSMPERRK
ncbi:MAG: protein kinase, partial [Acidobacteriota bacterium]